MRYFFQKKKDAQGRYKNPPVSGVKKVAVSRYPTSQPVVMYKMSAGPIKETTAEREARKATEATARYYARQAEKEAEKNKPKLPQQHQGKFVRTDEHKQKMSEVKKAYYARQKENTEAYKSQNEWAETSRKKKRNSPEACARVVERLRLRAEAKKKSTSVVITITITDPNKS